MITLDKEEQQQKNLLVWTELCCDDLTCNILGRTLTGEFLFFFKFLGVNQRLRP